MTTRTAIVAVDPGAKRTGFALWFSNLQSPTLGCYSFPPWEAVDWFDRLLEECVRDDMTIQAVFEAWVPYPNNAGNVRRDLIEVKTLGAMEWLIGRTDRRKHSINIARTHGRTLLTAPTPTWCHQQPALLKPTTARMERAGYVWRSNNRDEKAAEVHLWYWMKNNWIPGQGYNVPA